MIFWTITNFSLRRIREVRPKVSKQFKDLVKLSFAPDRELDEKLTFGSVSTALISCSPDFSALEQASETISAVILLSVRPMTTVV